MRRFEEQEILDFLRRVEAGEEVLIPQGNPQTDVFCEYKTASGWNLTIFNDCGEWDYIESISKGGRKFEYRKHSGFYPAVADYNPTEEIGWSRYGIPGYMKFRCKDCGKILPKLTVEMFFL